MVLFLFPFILCVLLLLIFFLYTTGFFSSKYDTIYNIQQSNKVVSSIQETDKKQVLYLSILLIGVIVRYLFKKIAM